MSEYRYVHVLRLPLRFPAGLSAGQAREGATMFIARNGRGEPILRGTSLAGVLRHAFADLHRLSCDDSGVAMWFGEAPTDTQTPTPSPLRVADTLLELGKIGVLSRQHNAVDRHRGSVTDGALFSLEHVPPHAAADVRLVLDTRGISSEQVQGFIDDLVGLAATGLWMGGSAARGIGLAQLHADPECWRYDLHNADQLGAWLDEDDVWRAAGTWPAGGVKLDRQPIASRTLRITCKLTIPPGQDLLVGDGLGLDEDSEPQQVVACDGKKYWRLPGSALRGPFRDWISRLAGRELEPAGIADSAEAYQRDVQEGSEAAEKRMRHDYRIGWCRAAEEARQKFIKDPDLIQCPVACLFGSLYRRGRLRLLDALSLVTDEQTQTQRRYHVAVDRFSGGANEGALFSDRVLIAGVEFETQIHLTCLEDDSDSKQELRWLAQTFRALDLGLIRIGSSKSAGRLSVHIDGDRVEGFRADQFLQEWENLCHG